MGFCGEQQAQAPKGRKISLEELSQVRLHGMDGPFGTRGVTRSSSPLLSPSPVASCLLQHRTPEDAWMTYKGKVYDVSGWEEHPGACLFF
jgi:cytochrome b involved in lipid metabolism